MKEIRRRHIAILFGLSAVCFTVAWWQSHRPRPLPPPLPPFHFPTTELAQIDQDLQARFAEVPTANFGILRVSSPQHNLYAPVTPREKATIDKLRLQGTEVAFYLMSRSLWLKLQDNLNFKPIQGPVYLSNVLRPPLPRAENFFPISGISPSSPLDPNPIYPQPADLSSHLPNGTPVPSPTPPPQAPIPNELQLLGNEVFEMAEDRPRDASLGQYLPARPRGWNVVAVPIRASQPACLGCHSQQSQRYSRSTSLMLERTRRALQVGDVLGVAFYIFRQAEKSPLQQKISGR